MARRNAATSRLFPSVMRATLALLTLAAATGCTKRYIETGDVPPPRSRTVGPQATYSYEHSIAPDPNYEPRDVDAFAREIPRPRPYRHPVMKQPRPPAARETSDTRSPARRAGEHFANTLFWGAVGAGIGSATGDAEKGAIIGASYGHMLDHGGLHGLFSPGTIIGGAAGAAFSGNRGKGALIGATVGHLLDDVFRAGD